jgi:hypothetical protein
MIAALNYKKRSVFTKEPSLKQNKAWLKSEAPVSRVFSAASGRYRGAEMPQKSR